MGQFHGPVRCTCVGRRMIQSNRALYKAIASEVQTTSSGRHPLLLGVPGRLQQQKDRCLESDERSMDITANSGGSTDCRTIIDRQITIALHARLNPISGHLNIWFVAIQNPAVPPAAPGLFFLADKGLIS